MSDPSLLRLPSTSGSRAVSPTLVGTTDLIWSYFRDAQDDEDSFTESSDGRKHRFHYCLKCDGDKRSDVATWRTAWTSNAKKHLLKKHEIDIDASKCIHQNYLWIDTNLKLHSVENQLIRGITLKTF